MWFARSTTFSFTLSVAIHGAAVGVGYTCWQSGLMTLPGISVQGGTGAEEGSSSPGGQTVSIQAVVAEGSPQAEELPAPPVEAAIAPAHALTLTIPPTENGQDESQLASGIGERTSPSLPPGAVMSGSGEAAIGISSGSSLEFPSTWAPSRGRGAKPGEGTGDGVAGLSPTPHARNKSPKYPDEARRLGQEGTVLLRVAVREDGTVESVAIATTCGFALLDQAAVDAVREWLFEPARFDGKPQHCEIQLPIRFVLKVS